MCSWHFWKSTNKKPRPKPGGAVRQTVVRYLPAARLDALRGLIFCLVSDVGADAETWVAKLQIPLRHFEEGSGQAVQYQPELYWP